MTGPDDVPDTTNPAGEAIAPATVTCGFQPNSEILAENKRFYEALMQIADPLNWDVARRDLPDSLNLRRIAREAIHEDSES